MKHIAFYLMLLLLAGPAFQKAWAQQVPDTLFSPVVSKPVYAAGKGPVVLIDEAHANFHTRQGRFRAFARVLEKDGYVVRSSAALFTAEALNRGKILVIANALHPSNSAQWTLPNPSAFSDEEIRAVNEWVRRGGSLFLIADHMPFPGAAEALAASFGFKLYNGFALKNGGGPDIFTPGKGLINSILTRGRNESESVTSLQTFTGQAFEAPKEAQRVVVLGGEFQVKLPQTAWQFTDSTPTVPGKGLIQGAFMPYGKGRLVIFGEAAMFTAQLQGSNKMGMNQETASQNPQFLLNVIHWLDGILNGN